MAARAATPRSTDQQQREDEVDSESSDGHLLL